MLLSKVYKLLFVLTIKFCPQKVREPLVQVKNVIKLNFKCRDLTVRSSVKNRKKATNRLWWTRFDVLRTAYRLTRPVTLSSGWLWFFQVYLVVFYGTVSILNIDFHFSRCVVSLSCNLRHQLRYDEFGSQGQFFRFEIREWNEIPFRYLSVLLVSVSLFIASSVVVTDVNLTAGVAIRFTLTQWKHSLSYVQDLRIMGQFNASFRLT